MRPVDLVSEWQEMCDSKDWITEWNAEAVVNLVELIDTHFMSRKSRSELIATLTMEEVIAEWLNTENRYDAYIAVFQVALDLYFKNNKTIQWAIGEIGRLEIKYGHTCVMTQQAKSIFESIPMGLEEMKDIIEKIKEHVEND